MLLLFTQMNSVKFQNIQLSKILDREVCKYLDILMYVLLFLSIFLACNPKKEIRSWEVGSRINQLKSLAGNQS